MPVWLTFAVYVLAVTRLTGLLTLDEITRPARVAITTRVDRPALSYLLGDPDTDHGRGCPWCMSIWVAAAVAPLAWYHGAHPAVMVPALALAASQIAGMISPVGRS